MLKMKAQETHFMQTHLKQTRKQAGFSLTELLVVLAIIAILAATFISGARAIIHFLNLPAA